MKAILVISIGKILGVLTQENFTIRKMGRASLEESRGNFVLNLMHERSAARLYSAVAVFQLGVLR